MGKRWPLGACPISSCQLAGSSLRTTKRTKMSEGKKSPGCSYPVPSTGTSGSVANSPSRAVFHDNSGLTHVVCRDGLEIARGPALTRTAIAVWLRNTCSETIDPPFKPLVKCPRYTAIGLPASRLGRVRFQEAILIAATSRHDHEIS